VILNLARRAILGALTFLLATAALYAAIRFLPGTPWSGDPETPSRVVDEMVATHHLDQGIVRGYLLWLHDVCTGNLGTSYTVATGVKVSTLIEEAAPTSLLLGILGIGIALVIAIATSFASALRPNGIWDRLWTGLLYLVDAAPIFWVAITLQVVFALRLHWLPSFGTGSMKEPHEGILAPVLDRVRFWILPPLCLALGSAPFVFRMTRANLLDAARKPFIRAARARGIPELTIVAGHAFAEARIHLVTWLGLVAPSLIGGSIIIEKIFGLPGLGRRLFEAVNARDYPVVMGIGVVMLAASVAGCTVADLTYQVVEPRLRGPRETA
jgi:peptide/nickel transport system permease protein